MSEVQLKNIKEIFKGETIPTRMRTFINNASVNKYNAVQKLKLMAKTQEQKTYIIGKRKSETAAAIKLINRLPDNPTPKAID